MRDPYEDEIELIGALKRGEPRAYRALVIHYQQKIYQICFRMLNDATEAEDMAQETFIRVFKSIDAFRGDSLLSTWLYRVAVNLCKNRILYLQRRAHQRKRAISTFKGDRWQAQGIAQEVGLTSARIATPEEIIEAHQTQSLIEQALASIDEELRALLILRDIQGESYDEIAQITGVPLGTVKSRIHRARSILLERYQALNQ
jgi:RNA polymerase sigma-70 factor, ECF subfamily